MRLFVQTAALPTCTCPRSFGPRIDQPGGPHGTLLQPMARSGLRLLLALCLVLAISGSDDGDAARVRRGGPGLRADRWLLPWLPPARAAELQRIQVWLP